MCEPSSPFWIDAQCGGRSKFEEDRLRHPWRPTAATSACVMRSINREMGSRSALVIRRDRAVPAAARARATERLNGHAHLRKRSASSVWAPRSTHWRRHGVAPLCPAPGVVAASASPRVTRKQLWPALWRRGQSAGSRVTRLTNKNHGRYPSTCSSSPGHSRSIEPHDRSAPYEKRWRCINLFWIDACSVFRAFAAAMTS